MTNLEIRHAESTNCLRAQTILFTETKLILSRLQTHWMSRFFARAKDSGTTDVNFHADMKIRTTPIKRRICDPGGILLIRINDWMADPNVLAPRHFLPG
jgi:hypothetical protein